MVFIYPNIRTFCCRNTNVFYYWVLPLDSAGNVAWYTVRSITFLKSQKFRNLKHIWAQEFRIRNRVPVFSDRLYSEMLVYKGNKEGTRRQGTGLRNLLDGL
jgi:hypothetical protein